MTRRTRSAALLTATAMAGLALSLAIAPVANADPTIPALGDLTYSPAAPALGDTLKAHGTGCLGAVSGTTSAAPAAAGDPLISSSVAVSLRLDGDFYSSDTAAPSPDGSWDAGGILLGDAGDYVLSATCTVTIAGVDATTSYGSQSFTVDAPTPPPTPTPTLSSCFGCDSVNPGGTVAISAVDFPAGSAVTVTVPGVASESTTATVDGGVGPVTLTVPATQAAGTYAGTVSIPSGVSVPFSVVVVAVQAPGGNADGDVPPVTTDDPADTADPTDTGDDDTPVYTGGGATYTSSKPTLPSTGVDSLWPGVIGGSLLVAGAGLVWAGRRRPESADAAV